MSKLREFIDSRKAYDFFDALGWCPSLLSMEDQALAKREWPKMMALLCTVKEVWKVSRMIFDNPMMNKVAEEKLEDLLNLINLQEIKTPEAAKELADISPYNGRAFERICLHWVTLCDEPHEINYLIGYLSHMKNDNGGESVLGTVEEAVSLKKKSIPPYLFLRRFIKAVFCCTLFRDEL